MSSINRLIRRIARAETPVFKFAKKCIRGMMEPVVPPLPRWLLSPLRLFYEVKYAFAVGWRSIKIVFYYHPMFQARCASVGHGVSIDGIPFVTGPVEIHVGNNVKLGGNISVMSGNVCDAPRFIMHDRSGMGWGTSVVVNQEVVLEEDVIIAPGCRISDSDGHPREADLRAAGFPPRPADVRPVRICRYAWVGTGSYIMKGVTIGEGSIVAANSVVMSNIPPYCLAVGNPAEVLLRNYGRPSTYVRKPRASAAAPAPEPGPAQ